MSIEARVLARVLPDLETVSREAAELFVQVSESCIASEGRFAVALSGGETPRGLYALLGSSKYKDAIDWRRAHFFWADERCVPKEHPGSNFKAAYEAFLSRVPVPEDNVHRIKGEDSPEKAAEDYEAAIKTFFGEASAPVFDLIILGVGSDGHTASLFPGSEALDERTRFAAPALVTRPGIDRVTLTLPVLNNAARILFLVSGASKAGVMHDILEAGNEKHHPAGIVHPPRGSVLWLLDKSAAAQLKRHPEKGGRL